MTAPSTHLPNDQCWRNAAAHPRGRIDIRRREAINHAAPQMAVVAPTAMYAVAAERRPLYARTNSPPTCSTATAASSTNAEPILICASETRRQNSWSMKKGTSAASSQMTGANGARSAEAGSAAPTANSPSTATSAN